MKQCIAEVLETQSEIIQLQRNVIDRLAAEYAARYDRRGRTGNDAAGGRPAKRHRRMKPIKRIDRESWPWPVLLFYKNEAERNTKMEYLIKLLGRLRYRAGPLL